MDSGSAPSKNTGEYCTLSLDSKSCWIVRAACQQTLVESVGASKARQHSSGARQEALRPGSKAIKESRFTVIRYHAVLSDRIAMMQRGRQNWDDATGLQ